MASIHVGGWLLSLFAGVIWLGTSYLFVILVYNSVFHPLARYPGPFWARISPLYALYHTYCDDLHQNTQRCHKRYGPIVRYSPDRLVFDTAEALRDIYGHGKNTQKSKGYTLHPSASGIDIHDCIDRKSRGTKRRTISQSFAGAAVTSYEPVILDHIRNLCEAILATAESDWPLISKDGWSPPQDIALWMRYLTMDVISDLVYKQSFNLLTKPDFRWLVNAIVASERHNHLTTIFATFLGTKFYQRLNPDIFIPSTLTNERHRLLGILANFEEEHAHSQDKTIDRNDITSFLLRARDPKTGAKLTEVEVLNEARLMITAGGDTTATALSSTLFYLSRHSDAYARLTEEIRTRFPSPDHIRQGSLLTSCHYLRACIDEAMRLTPPTPGPFWHEIGTAGATIDGEYIPEGFEVAVDLWAIHHNPAYFPDPFIFNPDRFMPKSVERDPTLNKPKFDFFPTSRANTIFPTSPSTLSPNSFQGMYLPTSAKDKENKAFAPFLLGSGSCVGKPLAYMEMSLALARIVWCMDFRAADVSEGERDVFQMGSISARSQKGPMLQFRRRGVEI